MITYKKYRKDNLTDGATLALKHRLYIPGWLLAPQLVRTRDALPNTQTFNHTKIVLAFDGDTPVAIALVTSWLQVMVFCRKAYRRQGIASDLITYLSIDKRAVSAGEGVSGTMNFWQANEIKKVSRRV